METPSLITDEWSKPQHRIFNLVNAIITGDIPITNLNSCSGFPCSKGVHSLQVWGVIIPLLILSWELMNLVFPFYTINSVLTEWFISNSSGCEGKKYLFDLLFCASICYTKDRWDGNRSLHHKFGEKHLTLWRHTWQIGRFSEAALSSAYFLADL